MTKKRIEKNLYLFEKGKETYYVARYTKNGVAFERSLGNSKVISLRQARKKLGTLLDAPEEEKKQVPTFAEILEPALADIKTVKQWKNARSEDQWRNTITTYAVPEIGDIPVDEVTRDDIVKLLKNIWFSKPSTASRLQQRLDAIFGWAIMRGYRTASNPAQWRGNVAFFLPSQSKFARVKHYEAPTIEELRLAVGYCRRNPCSGSGLLLFVVATVCRLSEARMARAGDIRKDYWYVPEENQKTGKEDRRVPLSSLAMEAIKMGASSGYLFPGVKGMLSIDTARLKLQDIVGRKVTVHGIRATFRDWCAEEGVPDAVAEKCLSHEWGNEVTSAYYRTDLFEQRYDVLQRWAKNF